MLEIFQEILNLGSLHFIGFLLVISRVGGFFLDAPIFSHRSIPVLVKAGLVISLSLLILPFISLEKLQSSVGGLQLLLNMVKEVWVGLILGFGVRLVFIGVQIAGQLIDYQMGFGFVNVVDPETRVQVPIMGQFLLILATLTFLILRGHHLLIQALVKTFEIIPLGRLVFPLPLTQNLVRLFSGIFVFAFKVASPVVISLFLVDIAYSVIARAVPQANILIVGFPLKIGLGILFFLFSLPLLLMVIRQFFLKSLSELNLLIKLF